MGMMMGIWGRNKVKFWHLAGKRSWVGGEREAGEAGEGYILEGMLVFCTVFAVKRVDPAEVFLFSYQFTFL
jgi:hypothetical protein